MLKLLAAGSVWRFNTNILLLNRSFYFLKGKLSITDVSRVLSKEVVIDPANKIAKSITVIESC